MNSIELDLLNSTIITNALMHSKFSTTTFDPMFLYNHHVSLLLLKAKDATFTLIVKKNDIESEKNFNEWYFLKPNRSEWHFLLKEAPILVLADWNVSTKEQQNKIIESLIAPFVLTDEYKQKFFQEFQKKIDTLNILYEK